MSLDHHRTPDDRAPRLASRVSIDSPPGGRSDQWLRPLPDVFVGQIAIPDGARDALVNGNADAFDPLASIDYGFGQDIGRPFFQLQAELCHEALGEMGLERGRDYGSPEYSGILCGPGCEYHIDDGFGSPGVLFVVTSVLGRGVLSMHNVPLVVPFKVGATVVFDALQVHGLCAGEGALAGGCPFVAVASEVPLTVAGCKRLGLLLDVGPRDDEYVELRRENIDGKSGEYRQRELSESLV